MAPNLDDRSEQVDDDLSPTQTPRRTVLRAAGLTALVGGSGTLLVACAADREAATTPSSTAPSADASSAPPSSSAPSPSADESSASSEPSETAEAPDGPSVDIADVPVDGGVILENDGYVVTQPSKGDYKAFTNICTHQRCKVTSVSSGTINCNCHGSQFSIKDGSVVKAPPGQTIDPLEEFKVEEFEKKVYVTG